MQSVNIETHRRGALLFVRHPHDVPGAIQTMNELNRRPSVDQPVLAIVVGLPPDETTLELACGRPGSGVTLGQSIALSGLWCLAWFDFAFGGSDVGFLRRQLLDNLFLVPRVPAHRSGRRLLFPVLSRAEAEGDAFVDDLAVWYPTVTMGWATFVHDPASGGVVRGDREREAEPSRPRAANDSDS